MRNTHSRDEIIEPSDAAGLMRFWRRFIVVWLVAVILSVGASILLVPAAQAKIQSAQASGLWEFAVLVVGLLTLLTVGLYQLGAPERNISESEGRTEPAQPSRTKSAGASPKAA